MFPLGCFPDYHSDWELCNNWFYNKKEQFHLKIWGLECSEAQASIPLPNEYSIALISELIMKHAFSTMSRKN